MRGEFDGKVAIVTGAASGLGRASAQAFAAQGAQVALADVDAVGLDETVAAIDAAGGEAMAFLVDLVDPAACVGLIDRVVAHFEGLDILCNVAGAFGFRHAGEVTPDFWDRIFAVNVRAPFFTIQAAMPHLIARSGAVVNVASASAFLGHAYLAPYAASKAALVNLTKSLAMEYMQMPVRINAIAPGGINTAMTVAPLIPDNVDFQLMMRYAPLRGSSEPGDLTDLILMLAGSSGRALHGACLNADRGITAG